MLFDSHAHMDVKEFDEDRDQLLERIHKNKVSLILNPGVDIETSAGAVELARKYDWIYAAVGYYPQETRYLNEGLLAQIEELAADPKVVAIGEIGLDYYWKTTTKDVQQFWFRRQIRMAIRLNKPIIIHDREAHGDVVRILKEEQAFEKTKVLFHCYSGSAEMARQLLKEENCFFSIAGPVTYGKNRKAKAIIETIPLDRMCVETDSPYLTPEPFRGKRNDPSLVEYTAAKIAELKGITVEEVAAATMDTAKRIFGIA